MATIHKMEQLMLIYSVWYIRPLDLSASVTIIGLDITRHVVEIVPELYIHSMAFIYTLLFDT